MLLSDSSERYDDSNDRPILDHLILFFTFVYYSWILSAFVKRILYCRLLYHLVPTDVDSEDFLEIRPRFLELSCLRLHTDSQTHKSKTHATGAHISATQVLGAVCNSVTDVQAFSNLTFAATFAAYWSFYGIHFRSSRVSLPSGRYLSGVWRVILFCEIAGISKWHRK